MTISLKRLTWYPFSTSERAPAWASPNVGQGSRRARRRRRAWLALGISASALAGAAGPLLGYLYVHPPRVPVLRTPAADGLRFEKITLTARDGTRLAGWFVPCEGARAAVVLCHGYPMNRQYIMALIPPLHRAGFHVLAFDFRALGESQGRVCTLGLEEPQDVLAAVAWLKARPDVDPERIGVLGWSMGAASALIAASQSQDIRAVVADSSFARLDRMAEERLRVLPAPLRQPLARSSRRWAERFSGCSAAAVSPLAAVRTMDPRPILFIHGDRDWLIPVSDARQLYAAAPPPRELWIVPGGRHVRGHQLVPTEYELRVVGFFSRHLRSVP